MEHSAEESGAKWILGVALSSALLAGFAAVAALLAGHNANEAMLDQIKAADSWNYYQAKGIKAAVLSSKLELLKGEHHAPSKEDPDGWSNIRRHRPGSNMETAQGFEEVFRSRVKAP